MMALSLTSLREPLRGTLSKRPSLTFLWEIGSSTTQYSLHFIEVNTHRSSVFYKLKYCGNPALSKFVGTFLQIALVFFSHFGNSHGILNFFFIIIIFVMVISDYNSLKTQMMACTFEQ